MSALGRRRREPEVNHHVDPKDIKVVRIVPRDGDDRIVRVGLRRRPLGDLYHDALTAPWSVFLSVTSAAYLAINAVFALLYIVQPGSIDGAREGSFADAFFFSVQTMATIGYGKLAPNTLYANVLVSAEAMFGLLTLALVTGLLFTRFSRPTARVLFSKYAVISPMNGQPTLSVRTANKRREQILQAEVGMTLLLFEVAPDGTSMRRFYDLALARQRTPFFSFSFQIMHPIDENSPFWNATPESLAARQAELLVTVTGLDETMFQTVHARYSYSADEIRWNHRFIDIFGHTEDGKVAIDYHQFHKTRPV